MSNNSAAPPLGPITLLRLLLAVTNTSTDLNQRCQLVSCCCCSRYTMVFILGLHVCRFGRFKTIKLAANATAYVPRRKKTEKAEKSTVQSLLHGSRGKYPYFCRHDPSAIGTHCKMRRSHLYHIAAYAVSGHQHFIRLNQRCQLLLLPVCYCSY